MFNKELKESNKKGTKMNNTISEKKKNALEGNNSRITQVEERISDVEDRIVKITATEKNKEKRMKTNEDSVRDLWGNIKCMNIHIIGISEGEERERKGLIKYLKRLYMKASLIWERKYSSPGSAERTIQDKPKEEYSKTPINETDKLNIKNKY